MAPEGTENFYQSHLNRVSRSFAFCIAQLRSPLKAWVGLTYLICRVLDTVEDAVWERSECQLGQLIQFDQFVQKDATAEEILLWQNNFPRGIPLSEKQLVSDSVVLFKNLRGSPGPVRTVVTNLVLTMSQGMRHFCQRRSQSKNLKLNNLAEVNQYCLFVAGVVGEALAHLLQVVEPSFKLLQGRVKDAHHFGLFLQKVNILKDQVDDEEQGRFLVPDRFELVASMVENSKGAWRFLESIPQGQIEFRRFCAWSMFLGLETLTAFKMGSSKVSRDQAQECLLMVDSLLNDHLELKKFFEAKIQLIFDTERPLFKGRNLPNWLTDIYQGDLTGEDLIDLGLGA